MASGGSTGRPKLIEVGGDSRYPGALFGQALGAQEGDVSLMSVPMSHNTGMVNATVASADGSSPGASCRASILPSSCASITEHRVSFLATAPTIMHRVLPVYHADPQAYDLSSIRRMWHVGGPCPPSVKEAWIEPGGARCPVGDVRRHRTSGHRRAQWCRVAGAPRFGRQGGRGRDEGARRRRQRSAHPAWSARSTCDPSPGTTPTYRYIGATAKTHDGWDSLGDLGYFDEDGYLYLSDRRVDMFTVGGKNTYPAEIEGALCGHPEVLSCLVVGVPHEDLGQVPHALVQADGDLDEAGVQAFLRERLEAHKVPRTVEFVDHPLRDDAGKARRSAVRDEVIARRICQARAAMSSGTSTSVSSRTSSSPSPG